MTYCTRRLSRNDTAEAAQLLAVFRAAFDDPASYAIIPDALYLESVLADERTIVLVAQSENGEVVGGILSYVLKKLEQNRSELYLYDLAVAESHRRHGVATALIETLKQEARAIGAYVIFVQADEEDVPAISLYSKLAREHITAHHFDITP